MSTRRSCKLVTFPRSFQLTGMDKMLPAGTYEVTTEEEQIGDFVYEAYRRISTSIYLPPQPGEYGIGQIVSIDPVELGGHSEEDLRLGSQVGKSGAIT